MAKIWNSDSALDEAIAWAEQERRSWHNLSPDEPAAVALANAQTAQAWATISLALRAKEQDIGSNRERRVQCQDCGGPYDENRDALGVCEPCWKNEVG